MLVRLWSRGGLLLADKNNQPEQEQVREWTTRRQISGMSRPFTLECVPLREAVYSLTSALSWVALAFMVLCTMLSGLLLYSCLLTRKALADTRQAQLEKDKAYQTRRTYFAFVVHELRSPLQSAISMIEFAEEHLRWDEARVAEREQKQTRTRAPSIDVTQLPSMTEAIQTMRLAAESMLAIVNDLLDLDRLEQGKLRMEAIPLDLPKLLRQLQGMYAPMLRKKSVEFALDIDPSIHQWHLGDPTRIGQVCLRALSN